MSHCPQCQGALEPGAATCPHCGVANSEADRTLPRAESIDATVRRRDPVPEPDSPGKTSDLDATVARPRSTAPARSAAGPVSQVPVDPMIGKILGGCKLEEMLGRGAMGAVYRATQINLDRTVAVKTIRPELVTDETILKRFQQEAKTIGRFSTPHVVQIHQVGYQQGIHFLVLEYIDGGDLRRLVQSRPTGRLESDEAVRYLTEACRGLQEARDAGVLHRDIKPDNLLLTARGTLKIGDFGIAKMLHSDVQMTMTNELTGTPLYMSPEQCRGEDLDFRSDMYSLGACFFFLVTGQPPAKGSTVYELLQTKTRIKSLSPERALPNIQVSGPLSRIIEKMTALDPGDRYDSYDDLLTDLDRVKRGEAPVARTQVRQARQASARKPGHAAGEVTQRVRQAQAKKAGAGGGLMLLLLLLLVGGGGYGAWEFYLKERWQPAPKQDGNPSKVVEKPGTVVAPAGKQDTEPTPNKTQPDTATKVEPVDPPGGKPNGTRDGTGSDTPNDPMPVTPTPPVPDQPTLEELRKQYRGELDSLQKQLARDGGEETVRTPTLELLKKLRNKEGLEELLKDAETLSTEIGLCASIKAKLADKPSVPRVPFDRLQEYRQKVLDTEKDLAETASPSAKTWATNARRAALDDRELRQRAVDALVGSVTRFQTELQERPPGTEDDVERRRKALDEIATGDKRLRDIYGEGIAATLQERLKGHEVGTLRTALDRRKKGIALAAEISTVLDSATRVQDLSGWRDASTNVQSLRSAAEAWAKGNAAEADLFSKKLDELKKIEERWDAIDRQVAAACTAFGNGDLTKAEAELGKLERTARATTKTLSESIDGVRRSLQQAIQDLQLDTALEGLGQVKSGLGRLDPDRVAAPIAYVDACRERIEKLAAAAKGMVPVRSAGREVTPGTGTSKPVPSFFMDPYEVSRGEFRVFLEALSRDYKRKYAEATRRYGNAWPTELDFNDAFKGLDSTAREPEKPASHMTYYTARAYLHSRGRELPTLHEWWVAAHGVPPKASKFPWGDEWKDEPRNFNTDSYQTDVRKGGVCRHHGVDLHHISGNVAEWVAAEDGATEAHVVGGSYRLNRRSSAESSRQHSGEYLPRQKLHKPDEDIGVRGVIRPSDFGLELR